MRKNGGIVLALWVLLACMAAAGEMRTWTSAKGSKIEAEMVKRVGRSVYLRTADGRRMQISIGALSAEDQQYIAQQVKTGAAASIPASAKEPEPLPADFAWPVGKITDPIPASSDDQWSFRLYLPKGFSLDRKWPVMFIMSPGSGKNARTFQRYVKGAERNGWVLAMSVESRNNFKESPQAVKAMLADVRERLPIDEGRMYASGFSGGARMAFWLAGESKPPLAGVLACGAGRSGVNLSDKTTVYGLCGSNCFNRWDMACTHRDLKNSDHRLRFFVGKHAWANDELLKEAMTHLDLVTLSRAKRTDKVAVLARDTAAAKRYAELLETAESDPCAAYESAVFLSGYKACPTVRRDATTLVTQLKKTSEVALHAEALDALGKFVDRHFATNVMDYQNNNGTKAAAKDGTELAEKYKDTRLAELFTKVGEKAPVPR
jgi:dienelactone hydrolase